jgi:hypothetical protein
MLRDSRVKWSVWSAAVGLSARVSVRRAREGGWYLIRVRYDGAPDSLPLDMFWMTIRLIGEECYRLGV